MLKQNQRANSPIAHDLPMSPNAKRRADFTIKQLQSGVIGRARSTLNTLGDVWRPKSASFINTTVITEPATSTTTADQNTTQQPQSPSVHRTLEFFSVWSLRNKKLPYVNKKKFEPTDENTKNRISNKTSKSTTELSPGFNNSQQKSIRPTSLTSSSTPIGIEKSVLVDNSNRNKNKLKVTVVDKNHNNIKDHVVKLPSIDERQTKLQQRPISRNSSLDMDLILASNENTSPFGEIDDLPFSRSYDDTFVSYNGLHRRNSCTDDFPLWENKNNTEAKNNKKSKPQRHSTKEEKTKEPARLRVPEETKPNVIKARLQLKKINSLENETVKPVKHEPSVGNMIPKHGILNRHSYSMEPMQHVYVNSYDDSNRQMGSSDSDEFFLKIQRPRKKLSFKEPIVCPKDLELKSDTLPKAKKFLEEYEEKRTSNIEIELEV